MRRGQGGFTLVEMVIAMAATSLVVFSAMALVLLCLRVQSVAFAGTERQDEARIALGLIGDLAADDDLTIHPDGRRVEFVNDSGSRTVLTYIDGDDDSEYGDRIWVGDVDDATGKPLGSALVEDVKLSVERLSPRMLKIMLTDQSTEREYDVTVCRRQGGLVKILKENEIFSDPVLSGEQGFRYKLLETAARQYGSEGSIVGGEEGKTFANWYNSTWDADTAWCGCFVSWCIAQNPSSFDDAMKFADAGKAWQGIDDGTAPGAEGIDAADAAPGDLVFFDLNGGDGVADHVAIVMKMEDGRIYTIEGNRGGRVTTWDYELWNNKAILGFARLDWKSAG